MTYRCSQCDFKGDVEKASIVRAGQMLLIYCPRCFELLAEHTYTGEEDDELTQYLPTADQCRYSIHLYQKQLLKVNRAQEQLNDMITKFQVLLEVMTEKEKEKERSDD